LAQDGATGVVEGRQQVLAGFGATGRTAQRLAVHRDDPPGSGPGLVACCAQVPARSSKASASRRCKVRRNVDSDGTTPVIPSMRRVCSSASAAHSAIAVNERAPATTAHHASPKITASR
jgi:hypothetical protein